MQLGDFGQIAFAREGLNLLAQAVDFLADLGAALGSGFFRFPDFIQVGNFLLQALDLFFDQFEALLGGIVFFALDGFTLNLQLDQAAVQFVHDLGFGIELDLDFGRRLVDQVNRLVGQKAVGDIAVAELGRSHDGRVGDVDAMVHLVALLQATQNGHRGFDGGFTHQDFLEAPL